MNNYQCNNCNTVFSEKGQLEMHNRLKKMCKKKNTILPSIEETDSKELDISTKTREELIIICKENKIKGYSGKKKEDIAKLLLTSNQTQNNIITPPITTDTSTLVMEYNVENAFEYLKQDTKVYKCIYLDPPYASGRDYKFAEKDHNRVTGIITHKIVL